MSNSDNVDKFKAMDIAAQGLITVNEVSSAIFKVQESFSRWLLGGSFAIIFAIFNNPKEMMNLYNPYFVKGCIIFLLLSIFYGFKNILGHNFMNSLGESKGFRMYVESKIEEEKIAKQENCSDLPDLKDKEIFELVGKKSAESFVHHLKKSKSLIVQILFIIPPLVGIVAQLIFNKF